MNHFRDPCIHCGVAHDDVPPGPCGGEVVKFRNLLAEKMKWVWCDTPLPGQPYPEYACGKCWTCRARAALSPKTNDPIGDVLRGLPVALLVAEVERIDRQSPGSAGEKHGD